MVTKLIWGNKMLEAGAQDCFWIECTYKEFLTQIFPYINETGKRFFSRQKDSCRYKLS